jgi:hypothetical protein
VSLLCAVLLMLCQHCQNHEIQTHALALAEFELKRIKASKSREDAQKAFDTLRNSVMAEGVWGEEWILHRVSTTMPGVDSAVRWLAFEQLVELASSRLIVEMIFLEDQIETVVEPEEWTEAKDKMQQTLDTVILRAHPMQL